MPDLAVFLDKHRNEIYDIISVKDGVYVLLVDKPTKKTLKKLSPHVKIKGTFKASELLKKMNQLLDGYSVRYRKNISELLGLESQILVSYELKSLNHSQKTLFGYALKGRGKEKGLLGELNGSVVGRNSLILPEKGFEKFKSFMEYWKIDYSIKIIYVDIQQKMIKK